MYFRWNLSHRSTFLWQVTIGICHYHTSTLSLSKENKLILSEWMTADMHALGSKFPSFPGVWWDYLGSSLSALSGAQWEQIPLKFLCCQGSWTCSLYPTHWHPKGDFLLFDVPQKPFLRLILLFVFQRYSWQTPFHSFTTIQVLDTPFYKWIDFHDFQYNFNNPLHFIPDAHFLND